MNLVVLGATGRTGRLVVEQALAAGHTVTALVRSPEKLTIRNSSLRVVAGSATDAADVSRALAGADADRSSSTQPGQSPKPRMRQESGGSSSSRHSLSNATASAPCHGCSRESLWALSSRTRAPGSNCSGRATSIGRSSTQACSRTARSADLSRYFQRGRSAGFQTGSRARTWRSR